MKKLLSCLLSLVMAVSLFTAIPVASAAEPEIPVTEVVVTSAVFPEGAQMPTLYFNTTYVVAPANDFLVSPTCTAPCFIVFGDEAYTAETARQSAISSGLADLAADEGAAIVYVNPQGDTWAETDLNVYFSLMGMYSNASTSVFENGIANETNFMTGATEQKILGDTGRVYIYAEGSGADFAAEYLMKKCISSTTYPDGVTIEFDRTATSVNLFNPATITDVTEKVDLVAAVVNGPEGTAEKLAAFTDKGHVASSAVTDGFDPAWIAANYEDISGSYRRQAGFLVPMINWAEEGIVEEIRTDMFTVTGMDGSTAELPIHSIVYYAEDLNVTNAAKPVPLVLTFHGGGNTALYQAQASEWPLIGKQNGFITVAVDNHTALNGEHIVQLVETLKDEYAIDVSRIYASGFSMGSVKSWELFDNPMFAGVAPMSGSFAAPTGTPGSHIMPTFYVGGEASPLPELCHQGPDIINRVTYLMKANKIDANYTYDAETNEYWGVDGDLTYKVTDKKIFTNSTLTVNLFKSANGKYYTALASSSNMSHEVYGRNSWAAWDFLKQFSRNADGSIKITTVDYTLTSDDSSFSTNSYNRRSSVPTYPDVTTDVTEPIVTSPNTGDSTFMGAVVITVLAVAGLAVVTFKKRAY